MDDQRSASDGKKRVAPASLPEEMNLISKKTSDQSRELGVALGVGGAAGAAAWFNRDNVAAAADEISPATGRGFVHALLWIAAFALIVIAGRVLAPDIGAGWGLIALAVMVPVGMLWSRRFGIR